MRILGIETATAVNSIAIIDENTILSEHTINPVESHNRHLLENIDHSLKTANLSIRDIDAVAVSVGPGSFTGIRIGISTAKSLAWASNIPLVGIPTLDALASRLPFTDHHICPILDARKRELYCALYKAKKGTIIRQTEYLVLSPETLVKRILEPTIFLGSGWIVYGKELQERLKGKAIEAPLSFHAPRGSNIALLALEKIAGGQKDDPVTLKPIYVRPSEAELNWEKKMEEKGKWNRITRD